jgi:hypothetical protein
VCIAVLAVVPAVAFACCPNDGNGQPKAKAGLGESAPAAQDASLDAAWQIYAFERDGVNYIQVNDRNGVVRAAVAKVDSTAWIVPMGADVDRVTIGAGSAGTVVYRSADFIVRVAADIRGPIWWIEAVATP